MKYTYEDVDKMRTNEVENICMIEMEDERAKAMAFYKLALELQSQGVISLRAASVSDCVDKLYDLHFDRLVV